MSRTQFAGLLLEPSCTNLLDFCSFPHKNQYLLYLTSSTQASTLGSLGFAKTGWISWPLWKSQSWAMAGNSDTRLSMAIVVSVKVILVNVLFGCYHPKTWKKNLLIFNVEYWESILGGNPRYSINIVILLSDIVQVPLSTQNSYQKYRNCIRVVFSFKKK